MKENFNTLERTTINNSNIAEIIIKQHQDLVEDYCTKYRIDHDRAKNIQIDGEVVVNMVHQTLDTYYNNKIKQNYKALISIITNFQNQWGTLNYGYSQNWNEKEFVNKEIIKMKEESSFLYQLIFSHKEGYFDWAIIISAYLNNQDYDIALSLINFITKVDYKLKRSRTNSLHYPPVYFNSSGYEFSELLSQARDENQTLSPKNIAKIYKKIWEEEAKSILSEKKSIFNQPYLTTTKGSWYRVMDLKHKSNSQSIESIIKLLSMANNWCTLCNATAKRYDRHYTDLIFINFEELERIQEEDISFDNPISADVWIIQSVNNLVSQITGSGEKQTIKEEYKNDVIELFKKLENNAALIGVKYEFALQKALSNFPNLNNYNLEFVKSATTLEIFIRHLDPRLEKLYQYVIESNLLPPLHHFASTKPENFKNKIDTYRDLPSSMRSLKLIKDLLL